jgi:hypothetical protein
VGHIEENDQERSNQKPGPHPPQHDHAKTRYATL